MIEIYESTVVPASADAVWEVVGPFAALSDWHPAVTSSELAGGVGGTFPGAIREVVLGDGAMLTEYLKAHSDDDRCYTYMITAGPLPIHGYESTLMVQPVTDTGSSFIAWTGTFEVEEGQEEAMREAVTGVYRGGLDGLKERFKG